MASIIEVPELVLDKIIEFSDLKAVLTLRQVCRDFRNFIDDLKDSKLPDSKFAQIEIISDKDEKKITFDFKFQWKNNKYGKFEYCGCGDQDLEWILKFQKSNLQRLYFHFDDFQLQTESSIHTLPIKLSNMFNASGRKIKTRELSIKTYHQSQVTPFLPIADLEALKIIDLYSLEDNMEIEIDEIVKIEQWKKAKEMNCDFHVVNLKVEDICHFSRYRVQSNTISARDLDFLKKAITSSLKFEYSWLAVNIFNENEEIFNLWGPAYLSGSSSLWYFRIKDSEENILVIDIQQVYNHIYFDVIETRKVPNRAIVHDYNEN
ncbi:Protein CBG24403 [Caenorhabditis briggsae]|uniref:Protein CBG24403 n=1 Tax=Caenorhabditis briggsae TaxID=6238 RepID=A8WKM6_CAEBR|nr:Protein CBG24403 [Caenorhabditis briggsae]CAP21021.1 Protein CBG24403 [Caenorhabditis briggsae]